MNGSAHPTPAASPFATSPVAGAAPAGPASPSRLGDYVVGARLERRPAADVYDATHAFTGAPRLVYVLRPGAMQNGAFVHRLAHEVDAARWLRHPAVAKVDACAETTNGRLYVAVERPVGRSLAGVLAEGGRMTAGRVVRLGSRLVEALDEAHAVGLAHGRLTPASVVVAEGWDEAAHALVTLTGLGVGGVAHDDAVVGVDRAYVSPEQRAGGEPDARSDVFGLSALLHHALFGTPPAEVDGVGGLPVDAVDHLPAAIVLAAARAADPAGRPASVKAFWEDLLDALVTDVGAEAAYDAPREPRRATPRGTPTAAATPTMQDTGGLPAADTATPAAPPSIAAPTRRRRAAWMHGLWLAVPLGAAAAVGWPGGKAPAQAGAPPRRGGCPRDRPGHGPTSGRGGDPGGCARPGGGRPDRSRLRERPAGAPVRVRRRRGFARRCRQGG
jgi:serine/threonine-protein kinase